MKAALLLFVVLSVLCYGNVSCAQLRLLNKTTYPNAVCIDGTQGGYYYRINSTVKNWIIYHQGGGECFSLSDCYARASTDLGSSKGWGASSAFNGMLSATKDANPYLYDWNAIHIQYCDGQSMLGNAPTPATYNGTNLFFRGQAILNAVLSDLQTNFGLKQAQNVIITGSSAGGIATYNHVDWWASNLPTSARVVGVPDAGWFVQAGATKRQVNDADFFDICNCKAGIDASCLSHYGGDTAAAHKCFNAENVYPFITTPIFIVQSRFDEYQARNFLGITCNPPNCSAADMQKLNDHGKAQYNSMNSVGVFTSANNSVFMDSCFVHVQTMSNNYWNGVQIGGETMSTAFHRWFANGANVKDVNNCDFNCNPTCP